MSDGVFLTLLGISAFTAAGAWIFTGCITKRRRKMIRARHDKQAKATGDTHGQ